MIQLTIKELLLMLGGGLGVVVLFAAVIRFLASTWIKARIETSVKAEYDRQLTAYKHEFDKKLEDYRNEIKVREQAAGVAALLAKVKWCTGPTQGEELDRLGWELSLWLPPQVVRELKNCLDGNQNNQEIRHVLIETRKALLREKAGELLPEDIPCCAKFVKKS